MHFNEGVEHMFDIIQEKKPASWGLASVALIGAIASGCNQTRTQDTELAAVKIGALVQDGTDVEGIDYAITPVSCDDGAPTGDPVIEESSPIDPDQVIPGNIEELKNMPLDEASKHLFADLFKVLHAGCYDVVATPVTAGHEPSQDCASANKDKVAIVAGQTTEVFMISQCRGEDPGALDAIVALNHEPILEDVVFSDSKFACGSPSEVCIEASDPDFDPVEIVLDAGDCDVEPVGGPGCFEVSCGDIGKAEMTATVYDQLHDGGSLVRIEDWLASEGYPNESHATLDFYAYVDGIVLYEDNDGDGYGDPDTSTVLCDGDDTAGYSDNSLDCDDGNADTNPDADEVCDDIDNDCDGEIDEGDVCAPPPPEPGTDIVVFNDMNPFDDVSMADVNNQYMVRNLVSYTTPGPRDSSDVVLMDYGRSSACYPTYCSPANLATMYSVIGDQGLTITDIFSSSGSLSSIAADVKVIFLWNPLVDYTVDEINALKDFAAEGGRVVFVGEHSGFYGAGIPIENAFLLNMGAVMTNIGNAVDCGYNVLPNASLRPHQVTTDMSEVTIACASVIVPGPSDYPLYYDSTNTQVLAGVATIDTTHIVALQAPLALSLSVGGAGATPSGI